MRFCCEISSDTCTSTLRLISRKEYGCSERDSLLHFPDLIGQELHLVPPRR